MSLARMWVLLLPAALGAQGPALPDTMIRPGHVDFSRYDLPSYCLEAAIFAGFRAHPDGLDTTRYAPEHDTLPSAAGAVARQCGAHFTTAAIGQRQLRDLTMLSLVAGDTARERAAADRSVAIATDPTARAWALEALVETYMAARPFDARRASLAFARLDSIKKASVIPRLLAAEKLWSDADRRFDMPHLDQYSTSILSDFPALVPTDRQDWIGVPNSGGAALAILDNEVFRSPPDPAVARTIQRVRETGYKFPSDSATVATFMRGIYAPVGQPAPRVTAKYWFGQANTSPWIAGRVSLVWFVRDNPELELVAESRRLLARFGDSLAITYIAITQGYVGDSPPLQPAVEADSLRALWLGTLKAPVRFAVAETPFHFLPDGRRVNDPNEDERFSSMLVDQHGIVLAVTANMESKLDAYIEKALHEKR